MAAPNGSSIFPLIFPTQPIPPEFLQDAYAQMLQLIAAQCAPNGAGATTPLSVSDAAFSIYATADNTKQLNFLLSGETTGKTATIAAVNSANATYTLPAATDTLVGRASTDTLTNKTLTGPVITDASDVAIGSGTGTKIGQSTSKIAFFGGTPVALPAGAAQSAVATTGVSTAAGFYGFTTAAQGNALIALANALQAALAPTTGVGLIKGTA